MTIANSQVDRSVSTPFVVAWLVLLVMVAAFIRVDNAGRFYYSPDEAMHSSIASGETLSEVLEFSRHEIHPPLSYILLHYWMRISSTPGFTRAFSLLFGLSLIPLYYLIGTRLAGRLNGLVLSTLIPFSHGCIIQSFVVRQYAVFLLCISLAFYCYLLWRGSRYAKFLSLYILFSCLAALSHFSAILAIGCIAGFELLLLWSDKAPAKIAFRWLAANLAIGVAAIRIYYLWQPVFAPLQPYFASLTLPDTLSQAPGYILAVYAYIFFGTRPVAIIVLCLLTALLGIFKPRCSDELIGLRGLILLAVLGLIFGEALFITGIYPPLGTRRSLWLLPLLMPAAGRMMSALLEIVMPFLLPSSKKLRAPAGLLLLFILGSFSYDMQQRFKDGSEYVWQQNVWNEFYNFTANLGPRDLIVTEKDDGIMLANLYRAIGEDGFTGISMAKLAPFRDTSILFNPYYPRNYSREVFLATLKDAQARHLLDRFDELVFIEMAWSRSPLTDLMFCAALPKIIITFPAFLANPPVTRDNIVRARAVVLIVSKDAFVQSVLSAGGNANACLNGKNDMLPGFTPRLPNAP